MARLGIDATLTFMDGDKEISGAGIKDLSLEIAGEEVQISSRGFDFKRYLEGQRDAPIDFTAEADAACVPFLLEKWAKRENVQAIFTSALGDVFTGTFIVTKPGFASPVSGEEEISFSLRLSATAGVDEQPTFTARTAA